MNGRSDVSPRHDGDLLYLTDTAYFALVDHESGNRIPYKTRNNPDGLFLERLESFIEGQQKEMESFASREQRPLDEIRKLVAIPHARYIFSLDPSLPHADESRQDNARNIPSIRGTLSRLSNTLQMLHDAAGLDSLLLVVSPRPTPPPTSSSNPVISDSANRHLSPISSEPFEASWIGGTDLGKEFWMGLKGGGVNGARAFRVKCQMRRDAEESSPDMDPSISAIFSNGSHSALISTSISDGLPMTKMRSGDVKTELNAAVRHALRSVSGNPSAEMRWTKPASLEESYNVRLIGWPPGVNMRNPSNNSLKENRLLLDLIRSGKMKFVQKGSPDWGSSPVTIQQVNPAITKEIVPQHKRAVSPPTIPSHSSVVGSLKSAALPVEPEGTGQGSSQSSSYVPSSRSSPGSLPTPRLGAAVSGIAASIHEVPHQSSTGTHSAPDRIAPKRQVQDHTPERETQKERDAKRAKLDSAGGTG